MAAALVDVVMLHEHGGRQHNIGEFRRIGHELLVYGHEQVVAQETLLHQALLGADVGRVSVLDEQGGHRRTVPQGLAIARQDAADLRLVELAHVAARKPRALQQALVEAVDRAVVVEGAAALVLPAAGDGGDGQRGVHVGRAVALAGKAVAEAEEGLLRGADQPGEGLDIGHRNAADGGRPFGSAGGEMGFEPLRVVGVFFQIGPVGEAVAEQHVHDAAGERGVGAGAHDEAEIGLLHCGVLVDVDDDDLRAAFLAGAGGVGHHVDLRHHRVGAPDDDAVGLGDLARIGSGKAAGAHDVAGPGEIGANRVEEAGIVLGVAQPVDGIALHQPHGAGVVVGPDGFGAVPGLGRDQLFRDQVEGGFPTRLLPAPLALGAGPDERFRQPVGMVDAFRIARDLGADDAGGVRVVLRAMNAADALAVDDLDVEGAGRRAVVRAGRVADADRGVLVHGA